MGNTAGVGGLPLGSWRPQGSGVPRGYVRWHTPLAQEKSDTQNSNYGFHRTRLLSHHRRVEEPLSWAVASRAPPCVCKPAQSACPRVFLVITAEVSFRNYMCAQSRCATRKRNWLCELKSIFSTTTKKSNMHKSKLKAGQVALLADVHH